MAGDRYATEVTGVVLREAGDGISVCMLPLDNRHRNARGGVMGGVMFTLADFAFAVAANGACLSAGDPLAWVSTSADVHFLCQPKGDTLTVRCQRVRQGRTRCYYQAVIQDEAGRQVAVVSIEGMHVAEGG
ncbi:MAG: PaaI family thioesterase [Bacteroidales bacterium]|nr:PaaI family thioesterase [Bacteroidales bacterium]